MKHFLRCAGSLILFALILNTLYLAAPATAQDATPVVTPEPTAEPTAATEPTAEPTLLPTAEPTALPTPEPTMGAPVLVAGSRVLTPALEAVFAASAAPAPFTYEATGVTEGFARFCQNTADMVVASRSISLDENAVCQTNAVSYIELLLGYNAIALISNPVSDFAQCLTIEEVNRLFAPSATGQIANWNQVNSANPQRAITIAAPAADTLDYALLDALVSGDGIRTDVTVQNTSADIIATVTADLGAVGVVPLQTALSAGSTVRILQINNPLLGCVTPSAENIENGVYNGERVLLYVNSARQQETGVAQVLEFAATVTGAAAVNAAGWTAPTEATYTTNQNVLAGAAVGRQFAGDDSAFQLPATLTGEVRIGGAAHLFTFVQAINETFRAQYPSVTLTLNVEGQPAGFRRFCNGELDVVAADSPLPAETLTNCTANNITPLTLNLGYQAVVLVRNEADSFAQCLTTAQLGQLWGVSATGSVTAWNQVDATFPAQPLTLFAPASSDSATNLLLARTVGGSTPIRNDVTETNPDPLYRAAATANVPGAVTFMSWAQYQQVLANNQQRIALIAVDNGAGCITPSEQTLTDGSYTLARRALLLVNPRQLLNLQVQSYLWFMLSDANAPLYEANDLSGVTLNTLTAERGNLQTAYTEAQTLAAQATPTGAAPSGTAEPTAEGTTAP